VHALQWVVHIEALLRIFDMRQGFIFKKFQKIAKNLTSINIRSKFGDFLLKTADYSEN